MISLVEATDVLLQSNDPAELLELADGYMKQYLQNPDRFILPREHATVAPFIETFSHEPAKWLKFVRAVRDELCESDGPRSDRYRGAHKVFRTLEVRYVQQERRERIRQAVAWLESQCPTLTTDQKKLWVKRLEQLWMKQRRAWLAAHRKQHGKRLNLDEQREVLDAFWADVDDNIKQGNLPRYE